jgi:hypothetical protein
MRRASTLWMIRVTTSSATHSWMSSREAALHDRPDDGKLMPLIAPWTSASRSTSGEGSAPTRIHTAPAGKTSLSSQPRCSMSPGLRAVMSLPSSTTGDRRTRRRPHEPPARPHVATGGRAAPRPHQCRTVGSVRTTRPRRRQLHTESRRVLVAPSLRKPDLLEEGAVVVEQVFLDDLAVLPACGGRVEDVERLAGGLYEVAVGQF